MAGGFAHIIMKKSHEKRFKDKQINIDDILVFDEDIPKNCKFTFVDFAPTLKYAKEEGLKSVSYSELIDLSNKWLHKKSCWDVISCETLPAIIEVAFNLRGELEYKQILSTYSITEDPSLDATAVYNKLYQSRTPVQFRVFMLRLWITRFQNTPADKVQPDSPRIKYWDFLPQHFNDSDCENIDSVVERVNQSIRDEEINGRVIRVQSLALNAGQDWTIDEKSTQPKMWMGKIVYILRVFYVLGETQQEEIGLVDFVPECLSPGTLFKRPKFESQTDALRKAYKWLKHKNEVELCSICSIDVKVKSIDSIDTKQMSVIRETGDFIRIIRIAYTKKKVVTSNTESPPVPSPKHLESHAFVLHKSYSELKKAIAEFMSRDEWTAPKQPPMWIFLSSETVFVMSPNALKTSLESNREQSFQAITSSKLSINRNLFFALKFYYSTGFSPCDKDQTNAELSAKSHSCLLM